MSIYGIMRTSTSGMNVQADRLSTVADNIANVGTVGYKRASTDFSTLVPEPGVLQYESGTVATNIHRSVGEQGTFAYTRSSTDLAVNGNGFFVVEGVGSQVALTRAGSFVPNSDGLLTNSAGYKLLGYNLLTGSGSVVLNGSAGLEPINVETLSLQSQPSREGRLQLNLPATADAVATGVLPSTNAASAAYSAKTSLVAYDNLGGDVTLDVYFSNTGGGAWEVAVFDRAGATLPGGFPYASPPLSVGAVQFDLSNGQLSATSASSLSIPVPNGSVVNLDLAGSSQLAADFTVQIARVDGNAPVSVSSIEISNEGILTAIYENGSRIPSYKIPIARVASPDNMTALSGNVFLPSLNSGDLQVGEAGRGGVGEVVSGALEQSTVDMAGELTAMIEAQRNYTANSRVFQTGADLMDVLVNLRR